LTGRKYELGRVVEKEEKRWFRVVKLKMVLGGRESCEFLR
jgi:hypothetical protein